MSPIRTHDHAASRFIDPKTLAKIGNMDLIARTVVEGFISGLHRSPFLGRSMDFAEYRAYMPGDDIRRVDWKLFSRTDRYFVKEFEADTNTNVTILLDTSASMAYGSGAMTKLDYARHLAACLAYFAHKQRDRIGLVTFDDDVLEFVPPSAKHLQVVLHALDRARPGGRGDLAKPLLKVAGSVRRRSIVVLISDFYDDPEGVLNAVKGLRYKGNDLILFHILDRAELEFPFDQMSDFRDMETGEQLPIVPEYVREAYRKLITEHTGTLSRKMGDNMIDYALLDTGEPLDLGLYDYLASRQRAMKVR